MNHPVRCNCGALRGHVALPTTTSRGVCYCRDCQAYARALGRTKDVLDDAGGTEIIAVAPSHVVFERGLDSLACVSLTAKGLLRWYAQCCATPVGNTPRDAKAHYVGLVHTVLTRTMLDDSFGASKTHINAESALRPVSATPLLMAASMIEIAKITVPARLSGEYHDNPFFDAKSGAPVRPVRVLTSTELAAYKRAS